jgi:hypothetical protein
MTGSEFDSVQKRDQNEVRDGRGRVDGSSGDGSGDGGDGDDSECGKEKILVISATNPQWILPYGPELASYRDDRKRNVNMSKKNKIVDFI